MIKAKEIYLSYDENRFIIKKGNFQIKPREFVFIGGASGSGKSTLLKSFYGDITLKHGQLLIDNQDMSTPSNRTLREVRKNIG
ncbi:MAG: ATP-binding cassette domain-containing protein, partial [Arcobacteraceae bacterium]|nr:ATP-binding cassette domain-containing protein [Arcobacteraceae bacterium]